jgi:TatD DNase family protein
MTDSHCHLDALEPAELEETLIATRSFAAVVSVATSVESARRVIPLAEHWPQVWLAVGLHPTQATDWSEQQEALWALAQHPRVRAIGETGLDYYWTPQTFGEQYEALEGQASWALQLGLPLVLHIRSAQGSDQAEREMATWLQERQPPSVVLHAFSGHQGLLEVGLGLGAYFSFAGPVTYKKNEHLRQAALAVPLERLLVETDSPYLPPEPHRGKRNQPVYVAHTLARLAQVREMPATELEAQIDQNVRRVFGLA